MSCSVGARRETPVETGRNWRAYSLIGGSFQQADESRLRTVAGGA